MLSPVIDFSAAIKYLPDIILPIPGCYGNK